MLNAIIRLSLHNRVAVIALALLLMAVGGYVATRMPVDVFPDLTAPTVTVITEAHGMAPAEVESLVTFPIEAAMNGAAGVRRVRSSTAVGISVVWVEFEWGTDIYAARQIVSEKLGADRRGSPARGRAPDPRPHLVDHGRDSLPGADLGPPQSGSSSARPPIPSSAAGSSPCPGVSQVVPIGGGEKQYQVRALAREAAQPTASPCRRSRRRSRASNENVSAGFIVEGGQEYLVTGHGPRADA